MTVCVYPVKGQVNLVMGQVNPVTGQVNPVMGQVNPVTGQVNPVKGQVNPVTGQVNPVTGQYNPVVQNLYHGGLGGIIRHGPFDSWGIGITFYVVDPVISLSFSISFGSINYLALCMVANWPLCRGTLLSFHFLLRQFLFVLLGVRFFK